MKFEYVKKLEISLSNLSKCLSNVLSVTAFAFRQLPHQLKAQLCHNSRQQQFEQTQLLLRHKVSEKNDDEDSIIS
jgi:hypothetical protein